MGRLKIWNEDAGEWQYVVSPPPPGSEIMQQTAKLTLLAADINNLASTPFELVAAPGANKVVVPYLLMANYIPGDIGYTTLDDWFFPWGTVDNIGSGGRIGIFNTTEFGLTAVFSPKLLLFEHVLPQVYVLADCADQPLNIATGADGAGSDGISAAAFEINAGGSGYNVNDQITVDGGGNNAKARVTSVDGGNAVIGLSFASNEDPAGVIDGQNSIFTSSGSGYSIGTGLTTSTGGGGTGLTVDIGAVGDGDGTIDLVLQYTIIDLA